MKHPRNDIGGRRPRDRVSYDEQFLRWVVGLSHATLRDAEATLVVPGALIGVTAFVFAINLDALIPGEYHSGVWVVGAFVLLGLIAGASGALRLLVIFSGALAAELRDREQTPADEGGNQIDTSFISDQATRLESGHRRCEELSYYREVLDFAAETVVKNRGPAYARILVSVALLLGAQLVAALAF